MHMHEFETPNVKSDYCKPFIAVLLQKMDMDISSDSSSSDEDTAIGAYWDSNVGLPFTDRVSEEKFEIWSFFFFLSIYDILIECCRYTWEIRPVYM